MVTTRSATHAVTTTAATAAATTTFFDGMECSDRKRFLAIFERVSRCQPFFPHGPKTLFTQKHNHGRCSQKNTPGPKTHKHRQSRRERQQRQSEASAGSRCLRFTEKHNPVPKTHKHRLRQSSRERQQRQSEVSAGSSRLGPRKQVSISGAAE